MHLFENVDLIYELWNSSLFLKKYFIITGMAPDVFRGNCIRPCTKCTQKQIRKVIVLLQQKYPKEFAAVLHKFRQGRTG